MPSESEVLKKLLEAEQQAKELVLQAEQSVAKNIEIAKRVKEERFRALREEKQKEAAKELEEYQASLKQRKELLLAEKRRFLSNQEANWEEGNRKLKTLLGLL
ncbi:MAG: hypothetical protein SNJ78_01440 [Spirochaetales bacterium]